MKPRAIFRLPTPEEAALARAQLTLAALRATLAQRESALTQLRSRLHSFEGRYIRQVGVLYVQLDDWYRRIAELDSPLELPESFLPEPSAPEAPEPPKAEPPSPSEELDLKTLYRQLARRIHHDPALSPAEALTHTLTQITQTEQDLTRIAAELHDLAHSEMASLERRTLAAAAEGHDLLAELAARVKGSIGVAIGQYERDLARFKRKQSAPAPPPRVRLPHLRRPR
jgi:hypothetical protein